MNDEKKIINDDVRFERKDVNATVLAWIGAGVVVAAILLQLFLYLFYEGIKNAAAPNERLPASLVGQENRAPISEQPQLQVNGVADMKQFRALENQKLSSYGWVNREQGVVRIPIEQAIRMIAERGLPKTNGAAQPPNNAAQTPDAASAQKQK